MPGGGAFGSAVVTSVDGRSTDYAAADFDQDGNLDIIRTADISFYDDVSILYGTGTGQFVGQVRFNIPEVGSLASPNAVTVADFNNDGKPDFATSNLNNSDVVVRLGNGGRGGGAFGPPLPSISFGGAAPRDLESADFNDDGNMDLLVARASQITRSGLTQCRHGCGF